MDCKAPTPVQVASLGELLDQVILEEPQDVAAPHQQENESEGSREEQEEIDPEEYLFELVHDDDLVKFRQFLSDHPTYPINHRHVHTGRALLHEVCVRNRREMLKLLLEMDDLFLQQPTRLGSASALHLAVDSDHRFVVFLLLSHGADPHARDHFGATPLHYVKSVNVAKLLFQYGAQVLVYDQKRRHVLQALQRRQPVDGEKTISTELFKLVQAHAEQEYKAKMLQVRQLRKDPDTLSSSSSSPKVK